MSKDLRLFDNGEGSLDGAVFPFYLQCRRVCLFKFRRLDRYGQSLVCHICSERVKGGVDGSLGIRVGEDSHSDLVRDLETAILPQILDPVDELARHAFLPEFIRNLDVQGKSQRAIVGNEPARHVLGRDFVVSGTEDNAA